MATLREIFTNIANAIRGKTSGIDTMTPEQMPTEINSIATIKNLLDSTKSTAYLFNNFKGETVDNLIKYNDTENVTDANHMFYNCSYLQTVPLLNTSNITSMNYMFSGCNILQTIPPLDTSNAQNLAYMFYLCENLQTIPPLDTSNATYMTYMFNNCYKLQKIDITVFVNNSARNASFAAKCYSLTTLIIRTMDVIPALNTSAFSKCYHFTGTTDATYNPDGLKDGRIYVPDDKVEELKLATNWSVYADIIVPLSTLVEE